MLLGDRWIADDGPFATARTPLALAPLVLWIPLAPAIAALAVGYAAVEAVRRTPNGPTLLAQPFWPWIWRALLTLVFALALLDLVRDAQALL